MSGRERLTAGKGIRTWVAAAVSHSKLVYALVAAMVVAGIIGMGQMKKNEFPAFEIKQGLVAAVYPAATAAQVETQLAKPLEDILLSFNEVDRKSLRTVVEDGVCYLYVDLNCSQRRKDEVWSKIKLKLNSSRASLPTGVVALAVMDDFGSNSSLLIAMESDEMDYLDLYDCADELCTALKRIPQLASVKILGSREEEIAITLDRERISAYALDPAAILLQCQSASLAIPVGKFSTRYTQSPIHIDPAVGSEYDIAEKIIWSDPQGGILRLRDVATIERRYEEADNFVSYNAHPCLIISVEMHQNNNIVKFGKNVDEVIEKFLSTAPESVTLSCITDQPKIVGSSVYSFLRDLLISMLVVIFVMLMLFPMRSALIASSGVPVCTAIAILIMYLCGMELNTVTLAALIVVLGMIVDDSIITMDGYMDKMERGYTRIQAAQESAKELFLPTFIATAAICLMFFPMLGIITGYLGDFIKLFPWVITFALMTSLFYAVTVVPSLETRFITTPRPKSENSISKIQNKFLSMLQGGYERILGRCFANPAVTVSCGVLAIAFGIFMFTRTNVQMMPKAARDFFVVEMELEGGNGLDRTKELSDSLGNILLGDSRVKSVTSFVGAGAPRFAATYTPILPGQTKSQLIVNTTSAKATESILKDYESKYEHIFPEAIIRFKQMDYQAVDAPVIVTLKGSDREAMESAADSIRSFMAGMNTSLKWVHSTSDSFRPVVRISLDHDEAPLLGVDKSLLAASTASSFGGTDIAGIWEDNHYIPVRMYSSGVSDTMSYSALQNMFVPSTVPGVSVPLRQVADILPDWEHTMLERRGGEKTISIFADMKYGQVQPKAMKRIRRYVERKVVPALPKEISVEYGGLTGMNSEVIPQVLWSFIAAVAVLFLFLLFHFKKLSIAMLTLLTSTLCLFGASLGLWMFNLDLSLTAVLGFVSLVGIVVRNGIILFEYAETLRLQKGMSARDAALEAGKRRMRPIFLTSCTTALGVLPMIISGDLLWQPMGVVICFGIVLSIFLIVLIMPVSYWLVFDRAR